VVVRPIYFLMLYKMEPLEKELDEVYMRLLCRFVYLLPFPISL
jgi:hypothetical protein